MDTLVVILILTYFAASVYVGYFVGTKMYSFFFGFLAFIASIIFTPVVTIPLMKLCGGRF
ncbi:MAG: hypothetical protein II825_11370 [Paludibacteraceae bacterium]|nr:hypothetical protein [Paludibacteraceae bacterium]MBQ6777373.1 hypothetical protein [Paludibacteraceae bacterium]